MVPRPGWKYREYPERYLANVEDDQIHDLDNEDPRCQIDEIITHSYDIAYMDKTEAEQDGYRPCPYCLPDEAHQTVGL